MRNRMAPPKRLSEKERLIHMIPFRLHENDWKLLRKLLTDEKMTFQTFVDASVQAYLRGDPAIIKVIRDHKDLSSVPSDYKDKGVLSRRERDRILDELDAADRTENQ